MREVLSLAVDFDHGTIDRARAVRFAQYLTELIESECSLAG
jgi:pyruvate/2-oxoglutarate dehydrogenase complex dihydrolipoamide acyltransferase (E2) component